ncbi:MAG: flagellar hook-basal body complex protein FliE, partial [Acidimicrobiia bacterium]
PRPDGFLSELAGALDRLASLDREATAQAKALATGRAEDVTSVVLAVERASLALQLAAQVRDRAVESYQDLFRMQI